jgi:DNA-binding transcriptional LysR family regulator
MDFHRLNAFVVLAEELSFTKAAARLHMSQPPLTRLISSLEEALGVRLFERSTRSVALTGPGVVLLKEAREIFARLEQAEAAVRSVAQLKSARLSVGFCLLAYYSVLPQALSLFRERFPEVELDLVQQSDGRQIELLQRGKLDVAFIEGPFEEDGIETLVTAHEKLAVLLPDDHRLASRAKLKLGELQGETFIFHSRKERQGFYDGFVSLLREEGITPKTLIKEEGQSCPILAATGKGVVLIPLSCVHSKMTGVKAVPLSDSSAKVPVVAAWRAGRSSVAAKAFVDVLANAPVMKAPKADCLLDLVPTRAR